MDAFQVIADPTRRKLIELLCTGERTAGELVAEFNVSFSAISQQLKALSEASFVKSRRCGRKQYYSLCPERLDPLLDWMAVCAQGYWDRRLRALGEVTAKVEAEDK